MKIPNLGYILTGLTGGGLSLSTILLSTLSLDASSYPYLRYVEVFFYDKSDKEEKIKVWIEDLDNISKFQYFKKSTVSTTSDAGSSSNQGTWESIGNIATSSDDSHKYKYLSVLAKYFLEAQHSLNLVKSLGWKKNSSSSEAETVKCKCKDKNKCKCCEEGKANECHCLCCLIAKGESKDGKCCCKDGTKECDIKDLIKNQKEFKYRLNNLNSGSNNTYLTPVQSHIKLLDSQFESDFKKSQESSSSSSSSPKNFFGSLIYGFVDYNYRPKAFTDHSFFKTYMGSNADSQDSSSSESSTTSNTYYYNIPNKFTFDLNKLLGKQNSDDKAQETTGNGKDINSVWKTLNDKKQITELIKEQESQESKDIEIECCPDETKTETKEIVKRNYVSKESDLSKIQNLVKNLKNCSEEKK